MGMKLMNISGRKFLNQVEGDGGNGDGGEAIGTGNDARIALLEQINDQNDALRADELQSINDDGTTEPFMVKTAEGEETPLTDEIVHEEIIDHDSEPESQEKFKIKVNGREMELTRDELIARAQKIESADDYLREAARMRTELEAQRKPVQDVSVNQEIEDDLALARAIQMGSEEEAVAAIRKLKVKGPSPDDLTRTIDERLTFNEAISNFREKYQNIVNDPYLNKLALDMDAQMLANGDKRTYSERYEDIGRQLTSWVKKFTPPNSGISEKQSRKEAASAPPKAASGKVPSSVEEEKEETVSDVIAQIAKQRGGPQWMNGMSR